MLQFEMRAWLSLYSLIAFIADNANKIIVPSKRSLGLMS